MSFLLILSHFYWFLGHFIGHFYNISGHKNPGPGYYYQHRHHHSVAEHPAEGRIYHRSVSLSSTCRNEQSSGVSLAVCRLIYIETIGISSTITIHIALPRLPRFCVKKRCTDMAYEMNRVWFVLLEFDVLKITNIIKTFNFENLRKKSYTWEIFYDYIISFFVLFRFIILDIRYLIKVKKKNTAAWWFEKQKILGAKGGSWRLKKDGNESLSMEHNYLL